MQCTLTMNWKMPLTFHPRIQHHNFQLSLLWAPLSWTTHIVYSTELKLNSYAASQVCSWVSIPIHSLVSKPSQLSFILLTISWNNIPLDHHNLAIFLSLPLFPNCNISSLSWNWRETCLPKLQQQHSHRTRRSIKLPPSPWSCPPLLSVILLLLVSMCGLIFTKI